MKNFAKFYINGEWVDPISTNRLSVVNPATEMPFATIAMGSKADAERAISAARAAFPSFSETSYVERQALMERILAILIRRNDEIGDLISKEVGAPISMARNQQAGIGISHFSATIKAMKSFEFEYMQGTTRIVREPVGVVSMITPWNWPMNQIACKVAPALASGCTMVLKPSEIAPLNAILFAEVLHEAGVPRGVFNLINGDGPTVGTLLASHPDIDMVSFTGSTRAGISIAQAAAPTVKRVHQELGGKSPYIVLRSANLEEAISAGVSKCFENSGQSCNAPTRMLVPKESMDTAIEIAARTANDIVVGEPDNVATNIGPVISEAQFSKIQGLIRAGIEDGAELIAGGLGLPAHLNSGYYVRPTVFARVTNDMTIARDEIFGPVLTILAYDTLEDAVAIANDTPYGLAAYIQGDLGEAQALSRKLRTGIVHINLSAWDGFAPFGGYKQSGNGREYGKFGLHEFTEIKGIVGYGVDDVV
ncbi:aldehyde dehydrogenase family protein [Rhizobium sp.]|jgi:aldehyde dehydrogenase (NAD+)|uniref:aldehyde dehydrogenase family protein n=1 Tax=Rhizobium sp. TaxID=391 RepID=UPI000E8BC74E|nr:aldehyde dehydrogenase family protein [Rhizobium sp.]